MTLHNPNWVPPAGFAEAERKGKEGRAWVIEKKKERIVPVKLIDRWGVPAGVELPITVGPITLSAGPKAAKAYGQSSGAATSSSSSSSAAVLLHGPRPAPRSPASATRRRGSRAHSASRVAAGRGRSRSR